MSDAKKPAGFTPAISDAIAETVANRDPEAVNLNESENTDPRVGHEKHGPKRPPHPVADADTVLPHDSVAPQSIDKPAPDVPASEAPVAKPADEPAPSRHVWSHLFNIAVLIGGGTALAIMMRRLGWDNAKTVFEGVGMWFFIILGLDLVGMCFDAAAIHAFMRPEARMVSFWRVFAAQASGRAINIFVPGGVVGEATKITMLVSHAPRGRVLSSIVLFNLATFYISVEIVVVGVPITAFFVDMPHQLAVVMWVGLAVLVPLVIALAVVIHRGAGSTVLSSARRMRLISAERATRWKARLAELDKHLRDLSSTSPGARRALAFLAAERVIAWIATTAVLHAIGHGLSVTLLIGVLSVGVLISWISAIVPLGLGIADGSNYALFDALGASGAHGVFVTLLNRARTLTLALIGLAIMAITHLVTRLEVRSRQRKFRERLAASKA
ncbi:MAG TPA: lysylphosphatidylglycerol synthase domain-containing protein [Kofleriaceae bacterium]